MVPKSTDTKLKLPIYKYPRTSSIIHKCHVTLIYGDKNTFYGAGNWRFITFDDGLKGVSMRATCKYTTIDYPYALRGLDTGDCLLDVVITETDCGPIVLRSEGCLKPIHRYRTYSNNTPFKILSPQSRVYFDMDKAILERSAFDVHVISSLGAFAK
mmetsp:Transcript_26048/g.28977  ORF Transcript_26048/g.28977 Transcript_26048/m.28977 type:complete len:156 (-) Transcript_26048:703-1170(-)